MRDALLHQLPAWLLGYSNIIFSALLRFQESIAPDIRWTILYVLLLMASYLFHSPFRAHNGVALDTYARVTKVFQTWSIMTLLCFHVGPQVVKEKQEQLANFSRVTGKKVASLPPLSSHDDASLAGIVFLPIFISLTCILLFVHKMKRRWRLGVTYGSSLTMVLMNSILLTVLAIMHHAFCRRLFYVEETVSPQVLANPFAKDRDHVRSVASTLSSLYSFFLHRVIRSVIATPSALEQPFTAILKLDLLCIAFMSADYLYKKHQGNDPSRGILWAELYDLRKGGSYREQQAEAGFTGDSVSLWARWLRWVMPAATAKEAAVARDWRELEPKPKSFRRRQRKVASPVTPNQAVDPRKSGSPRDKVPLMYNEAPVDYSFASRSHHSGPTGSPHQRNPTLGGVCTNSFCSDPAPSNVMGTVISFRDKASHVRNVAEAQHPMNKPGMVPWWSTFSLVTAWQSFIGSSLKFMSFDVRTIQGYATPKIFDLQFQSSVRHICSRVFPGSLDPTATAALVGSFVNANTDTASVGPARTTAGSVGSSNEAVPLPQLAPADVWFDWIADVGDGFNPTYEMARLMAQPFLYANVDVGRRRHVLGKNCLSGGRAGCAADDACLMGLKHLGNGQATLEGEQTTAEVGGRRGQAPTSVTSAMPAGSGTDSPAPDGASTMTVSQAGRRSSEPLIGLVARAAASRSLQRDASPLTPLLASHTRGFTRATASSNRHMLPRGSFVLVGGDLAYPSPTDETYSTRLFDPYMDALPGSHRLKKLFHAEQRNVVVPDVCDDDVAHITMLDAESVASRVLRGCSDMFGPRGADRVADTQTTSSDEEYSDEDAPMRKGRNEKHSRKPNQVPSVAVTAAEALYSAPMLFAIPGNHDWFDGLTTFRKWIVEKTWMGGWLMPQRSSFFVLKLPYNWFILCMDTGNEQDINTAQRNYFLHAIENHMDDESCVILTCHEPGWLFNAMEHRSSPLQPEVDVVVRQLGTRLRLRIAGDIHNYSRHVPVDPISEAATLIVSGGGGAYMYGARDDQVIEQGTRYMRAGAFPRNNTYMSMASRLWGFRVVNWKFDIVVGVCCFGVIYSLVPIPIALLENLLDTAEEDLAATTPANSNPTATALSSIIFLLYSLTAQLFYYLVNNGLASFVAIGVFFMLFHSAGADRNVSAPLRAAYGGFWTLCVVVCCCMQVAALYAVMGLLSHNKMMASTSTRWDSYMERELRSATDAFWGHLRVVLQDWPFVSHAIASMQQYFYTQGRWAVDGVSVVVRALDPLETLYYLSCRVTDGEERFGAFSPTATRFQVLAYYGYMLLFYWIIVTPVVSFIIGMFLFVSATAFDFMYDGTYSAFQIEDFKHFLRFRIDCRTRQLHGYVVAEKKVPKVWEQNSAHVAEMRSGERRTAPPHLRLHPSRWVPSLPWKFKKTRATTAAAAQDAATVDVLEHFVIAPHRTGTTTAATGLPKPRRGCVGSRRSGARMRRGHGRSTVLMSNCSAAGAHDARQGPTTTTTQSLAIHGHLQQQP